jgi:hypothetical protein
VRRAAPALEIRERRCAIARPTGEAPPPRPFASQNMKHVVSFSGGLCSFWAAKRVVERHGAKDVTLLFADVLIEDPELYAFNQWVENHLQVPITRVSRSMTPWQLFRKRNMIANNKYPICSVVLKREPLDEWLKTNCDPSDTTIYLGFDWTEQHRLDAIRAAKAPWKFEAPMAEAPIWDKCRMQREGAALGFKLPLLYTLGFPHFNCGGRCVKAGISHWVHLYRTLPERYLEWEREEQETITHLEHQGRSTVWCGILKDRRGGVTKAMTLKTLRTRIESGEDLEKHDWGGCGCGGTLTDG